MNDGPSGRQPRKIWMLVWMLAAIAVSAAGWLRLQVDSSLEPLLPEHSAARQTILFFRDSSFARKAVLWFRLTGDGSTSDLYAAADAVEKQLDPKLITRVIRPPNESNAIDEALALLNHADELLNEKDLEALRNAVTPDALRKRMRECYMQLTRPEGSFLQQIIRRDPLGVNTRILSRLYALSNGLGYRVQVKDGHFVNADGRQLLLILETSATATSLSTSEELANHLQRLCAQAPPGIQITPICAQIHTAQNDKLMQHDIHQAATINSIAFVLLFLCVSRDWRVAAVFLLPLGTTALAIGWCALFHPSLSTMMIGLTVAMAGSAVDYGIFVYTAVRLGSDPNADVRRIRRPLLISHLTTLGVFVALLFSSIPAYRQLGYLTGISLITSLLAAIFVLPKLLKPGGKIAILGTGMPLERWGAKMIPAVVIATMLFIVGAIISSRTAFDSDISSLDGVSPEVKQAEKDFQTVWERTGKDLAILVVTKKNRAEAEAASDEVYRLISPHFPEGQFVSLSSFWPSAATRGANIERWRKFWSPERITDVRRDLAAAAAPYGFSSGAFDSFFQSLTSTAPKDESGQLISSLQEQFVARANDDWEMLSYFEDTPANVNAVQELLRGRNDVQVVSRGVLNSAFKTSAVSETRLLVSISVALIILSLVVLTRSLIKSLIILLPVICGFIAMLATLQMTSLSMNIVTIVTSIIVLALTSDYGIFAMFAWQGRERLAGQGMASVHLSFLTTLAGTGVMILARHPALYLVGVSLTSGLLAGYLVAVFVIPGICFLRDRRKIRMPI